KRSLASVAAVAIASGAVVAPANAMTVRVSYDDSCSFFLTAEETKLIGLASSVTLPKEQATQLKSQYGEQQLSALEATIEAYEKKLTEPSLDEEQKNHLTSQLEENKKRLTAYKKFSDALDACIAGMDYNSDESGDSKEPGGTDKPGDSKKPGGTDKPGDSKKPGGTDKPGDSKKPGGTDKPGDSKKPGGTE
ncbi:hypothetical protein I4J10_12375, partial [Corynebacterium diphtheriae bv. mitis]|uniref:hypothetical protein n=1 Tax=Corynebacterium diphtheriae TaxID=1717 RepID=UPI0018CA159B